MEVDYLKLAEQYASFLIAVGGVSITVLTLILSISPKPSAFLVAALVVATVSCFTGAHMMAETAAFISYSHGASSGERLFLLASINIFIAIILVVFALMLLPTVTGKVKVASIKPIPGYAFAFVMIGALYWMVLSAVYRVPVPQGSVPVVVAFIISVIWSLFLYIRRSTRCFLKMSFIPILGFTFASLLWFARSFSDGGKARNVDVWLFCLAITSTCASLAVASIQPNLGEQDVNTD